MSEYDITLPSADDIGLAQQLLDKKLTFDTKPTEREARAAARRVLEAIYKSLCEGCRDQTSLHCAMSTITFLSSLANALDPNAVPEISKRTNTRKIVFKDASKGAKKARAALADQVVVALLVQHLRHTDTPGAVRTVAAKFGMESSQVSRIRTAPDIKRAVPAREGLGITEIVEITRLLRAAQRGLDLTEIIETKRLLQAWFKGLGR